MIRLCVTLGKTRKQLLTEMDSDELTWWMAAENVQPLPDSYWQTGVITSTVANCLSGGRKRYQIDDFMPRVKSGTHGGLNPEDGKARIMSAFAGQQAAAAIKKGKRASK